MVDFVESITIAISEMKATTEEKTKWFNSLEYDNGECILSDDYETLKDQTSAMMLMLVAQESELKYWRKKK